MRKSALILISFLVFGLVFFGYTSFIPGVQGLSYAQEGGIEKEAENARERAAEILGQVAEAEDKLAVSRTALDAARARGDSEGERAILDVITKLEGLIDTARDLATRASEVAEGVGEAGSVPGARAGSRSVEVAGETIDSLSSLVSSLVSLTVAIGAGDMDAAQEADRLASETESIVDEALSLASDTMDNAEKAIETTDTSEAAGILADTNSALADAKSLSSDAEDFASIAEEVTIDAARDLGIEAPSDDDTGEQVLAEIKSGEEEEEAREMGLTGATEGVAPQISLITYPGSAIGTPITITLTGNNFDPGASVRVVSGDAAVNTTTIVVVNINTIEVSFTPGSGLVNGAPVELEVSNPDGTSGSATITIPAFPTLGTTPFSEAPAALVATITIFGTNFGTDITKINVDMGADMSAEVTAVTPDGTELTVVVTVDPSLSTISNFETLADNRLSDPRDLTITVDNSDTGPGNSVTLIDGITLQLAPDGLTAQLASIVR